MRLETIRHPLSAINKKFLKLGGYAQKYNPNQTTAIGTAVTLAGTGAYVAGILSGSPELSLLGIGGFTVGRYADLLDGDHARLLREQGRWNTKSGGILDADMDKAGVFLTLGALIYTNTLPETHKYLIGIEVAIMAALDTWSYRLRSPDRDWRKVWNSIKSGSWDESIDIAEVPREGTKKIDANAFGKAKTLLQTLGITALGVGALIDNPEMAHNLQKLGHPIFLGAIGFASASLVSKLHKK